MKSLRAILVTLLLYLMSTTAGSAFDQDAIVGIWLFDDAGGDVAKDSSGNGLDGVLINGPEWVDNGKVNGALLFTAANADNVRVPLPHNDTVTVAMWANYSTLASNNIGLLHVQEGDVENADPDSKTNATWGDGQRGGGLWFAAADGSNVIAPVPHLDTLTITMWALYTDTPSNNIGLIHVQAGEDENADPGSKIIGMWVENTSTLWGRIIPDGVGNVNLPKNATVDPNVWNDIALVINAASGKATQYLNGEAVGEVDYTGTLTPFTFMNIGRQGSESWEGGIDEVALFDVALTQAEIQAVMQDGFATGTAVSPQGKLGTIWGDIKQSLKRFE